MRRALLLGCLALAACSARLDGAPSTTAPSPSPSATSTTPAPTSTSPVPTTSSPAPTTTAPSSPPASTHRPTTPTTTPTSTATPTATPTATSTMPAGLLGRDVTRISTTAKVVALTFDAGGDAAGVSSILGTLRAKGVPASFFLTGNWVRVYRAQARAIAASGVVIGNHTMTHPHAPGLTAAALTAQVLDAAAAIRAATGRDPRPWFRFPYGERTTADVTLLNRLGYVCIRWGVDTLGWQGTSGGRSVASVEARVLGALNPGLIVLMHVGSNPTDHSTLDAAALPALIDALRARGYSFVTLGALLAG
jgi:peptidoglycan/xylan/chitin deacetylase (PgdA/CDA1 family)